MGKLLSYSGISTKIRAMQSKLITEDQIQEMLQFRRQIIVVAHICIKTDSGTDGVAFL